MDKLPIRNHVTSDRSLSEITRNQNRCPELNTKSCNTVFRVVSPTENPLRIWVCIKIRKRLFNQVEIICKPQHTLLPLVEESLIAFKKSISHFIHKSIIVYLLTLLEWSGYFATHKTKSISFHFILKGQNSLHHQIFLLCC